MGGSNSRCDVRLRVDRGRACLRVKQSLIRWTSDGGIEADDFRVHGSWKPLDQASSPCPVRWKKLLGCSDRSRGNPLARHQSGRQSPGNAKADDARNAAPDRRFEMGGEVRPLTADDGYARAQGDPRL